LSEFVEVELEAVIEAPRLYTVPPRGPVDEVADQHKSLHADFEAWARWCREGRKAETCESIEGMYEETGGRESKAPIITLPENPRHRSIDHVVRYMRMWMPTHGECIVLYYVERREPRLICRKLRMHWSGFGPLMFNTRAAVLNLLRRKGA
jgi:hypothetical protein